MRHYILFAFFLTFSFVGYGQTQKISNNVVWSALYPGNSNFDNGNKLIRKVKRSGAEMEFRTELVKIFYYKVGQQQKALVILFSYDFTSGEAEDCHICHPEMEMATFQFSNNNWSKTKFVQNWKEATGSWGAGPELEVKKLNAVNCLVLTSSYGNNGDFNDYIDYYNIETLKKVKSIKK
jgi:hypothetical protein